MNEANGPVTKTLLTLLVGLPTISSFSGNEQEEHEHEPLDYADVSRPTTALTSDFTLQVGITQTSA